MLNLKKVLINKGIPFTAAAACLEISDKTLYNKLAGITDFTYGEAKKIKTMLPEYDLDYLLTETDDVA